MKFHTHNWLKWSDPVVTADSGYKQQWRICEVCNKAQFRTLFWDKQTNIQSIIVAIHKTKDAI